MSVAEIEDLARVTEDLGFDDLWVLDQSFHHDPFLLLARCAAVTSRLRIGVAVTNPVSRHPVQIARSAAPRAEVAPGRFVLGLGAGNRTRVLPSLGLPTDRPATRVAEALEVCRRLLAGESVTLRGETLTLLDVALESPTSRPVPIFLGSRGPSVLRLAGAAADGAFVEGLFTPAGLEYAIASVGAGLADAGRDRTAVEIVAWQALRLSTTVAAADDTRYRRWAALLLRSTGVDVLERIGIARATTERVRAAFDAEGEAAAAALVPDDAVSTLVLSGDPDAVGSQLERVRAAGIDTVAVIGFGNTDVVQDTLRRFAVDVIARWRG